MAIVRVQGNARGTSTGDSISVTQGSTPTNGNVNVAVIALDSEPTVATVTSITQTNVTWTQQVQKTDATYTRIEIWYGVVGASAGTSITVNLDKAAAYGGVANVCEYSGMATSNFLDVTATNSGTGTTATTGTTASTAQNDELWIGGIAASDTSVDQSNPTNGFSLLDGVTYSYMSCGYLEKIVSSTGAASSGTTVEASVVCWSGCIATFKAAGGAPPVPIGAISMHQIGHNISKIIRG